MFRTAMLDACFFGSFRYASAEFAGGTDWRSPGRHTSGVLPDRPAVLNHTLDNTTYFVHTTGGTVEPVC